MGPSGHSRKRGKAERQKRAHRITSRSYFFVLNKRKRAVSGAEVILNEGLISLLWQLAISVAGPRRITLDTKPTRFSGAGKQHNIVCCPHSFGILENSRGRKDCRWSRAKPWADWNIIWDNLNPRSGRPPSSPYLQELRSLAEKQQGCGWWWWCHLSNLPYWEETWPHGSQDAQAATHHAELFRYSSLLARRGWGGDFFPPSNSNSTETSRNYLEILRSLCAGYPPGRLLPWTCWWPQILSRPEEKGGLKQLFAVGCQEGQLKQLRRVPHHTVTISMASSWLFLTSQLFLLPPLCWRKR